ncbi:ATP-dependent DNA ligase [Paenibacillus terreus]|uniref:ATP-dependent DNA ligase n=1 Tax=Paenibacillus terreus TaxID=1387834 RepID=UPI0035CD1154
MYVDPMLLVDCPAPFESDQHIGELKLDGIRGILDIDHTTRLYTRHRNEITSRFEEITSAASNATARHTVLDGEFFVSDPDTGAPNFAATMSRFSSKRFGPKTAGLTYVAFDILTYKGKDTKSLPLMERKAILEEAIKENDVIKKIRYTEHGFTTFFDLCKQHQLEGIVLKKKDSKYYAGKRPPGVWQRIVVFQREECYITGYSKKDVSWLLGMDRGGRIVPVGAVKYGITGPIGKTTFPQLKKLTLRETKDYAYVEPLIKVGVRFRHWNKDGSMRLPVVERLIQQVV